MLKFNLYLLFKNTKFRVMMVTLVVAAILAGVIMVPKNKAASMSTPVSIVAKKSGITSGGVSYYTIAKNSDVHGYNTIFCIQEDAHLSSRTYSTRYDFYSASSYFSNFNAASWLVSNMYVKSIQSTNTRDALALNLANILTTNDVKARVRTRTGFDGANVTPQKIYNISGKTINSISDSRLSVNAMEFAEQMALWKYTNNKGNSFSGQYANVNNYLSNSTLSDDEQRTLKYMSYAFEELASMNSSSRTSSTVYNLITLNKKDAMYNYTTNKVGPYYIEANGIRLTSYEFGSIGNGAFPVNVTITNSNGTTNNAGAELIERAGDGAFYVNLANYPDAVSAQFHIDNIVSKISTTAYVLDGGSDQDLLTVDKDVNLTSLSDTIKMEKKGNYNVILKKVKKDGTTVVTGSEAIFIVNDVEQKTKKGQLTVAQGIKIENAKQTDIYNIQEKVPPVGYIGAIGTAKLTVNFKESGYKYLIDKSRTTIEGIEGARIEVSEENATITVYVPNEQIKGKYSVILKKVKEDGTTVITDSEAEFKISGAPKTTKNGILNIFDSEEIYNVDQNPNCIIEEVKAPDGYIAAAGQGLLSIKFKIDGDRYIIDKENTTLTGMEAASIDVSEEDAVITIYVKNTEKSGKYNVVLKKVEKDGTTVIANSEATFKINDKEETTTKGVLTVAQGKSIENEAQTDTFEITETKAPMDYVAAIGTAKLTVNFKQKENTYIIDKDRTTIEGVENAKIDVSEDDANITVYIPNEKKNGNYSVILKKVDEDGKTVITSSEATFRIGAQPMKTENGILTIAKNVGVSSVMQNPTYRIEELEAPEGYSPAEGVADLSIKFKLEGTNYVIDKENTTITGMEAASMEISENDAIVTIYIPNRKKEFDLSLRKYITKINGNDIDKNREPVINKQSIEMLEKTGTASYYHPKNSLSVSVGDEVEYTIRVYNEGEILGTAKQITDYLPDGLTFVKLADTNSTEYTTDSPEGSKVVVINYTGNKTIDSLRDFIGKDEVNVTSNYYQEVKLICKVDERENSDKKYMTNRAEITVYGYTEKDENGNDVWVEANKENIDRDSVENTIKDNLDLDDWYEKNVENSGDEGYYPGEQDDDDFETLELVTGKYNIILKKVKEDGTTVIANSEATFTVNAREVTTTKGILTVAQDKAITNKKQANAYVFKEIKAPDGYKAMEGLVKLTVRFTTDGNKYVIDKDTTVLEGNESVKMSFSEDNTTVTVYIPNIEKEFDLSLRKYITKINGNDVEKSREPVINKQSIEMLEKTGTASYYHPKNSLSVTVGDEVEYTIRVYNEGEILGTAKQITDYLPDGLTFVKLADTNSRDYTTNSAEGSNVVVINYNGVETIDSLRDFIGKDEINVTSKYYQEVKLICKVGNRQNTDKKYMTNRAEITVYGYTEKDENGNDVWVEANKEDIDRDSVEDTIKNDLGLDDWYITAKENTYEDEEGKTVVDKGYYPGVQDDDDFETLELITGDYNVVIEKVDADNVTKTLEGAYFTVTATVNGETKNIKVGPTDINGLVTVLKNIQITNDKQIDTFIIEEITAPENYNPYTGKITVKIGMKLVDGTYVIDENNVNVSEKNVDVIVDKTNITIVIPDDKKNFDLALRKFITEVNGKEIEESRVPEVNADKLISKENTTAKYTHTKNYLEVNTTDKVTYTLRVYNEGELNGYASKIMDDIPEGLEFIAPEYDMQGNAKNTNAQYRWKMYRELKNGETATSENTYKYLDKSYVVTTNVKEASFIVSDYLSIKNGTDKMIKAFNPDTMKIPDSKDIKVEFKVVEPSKSTRLLTNKAQISENTDEKGEVTYDRDSTPNVWKGTEDDEDVETVRVRHFDLALRKWVTKSIVKENGEETVTETNHTPYDDPEPIVKVDLKKKKSEIGNIEVKFEYTIRVINEGQIEGYAKEISDYIPEGLKFVKADNPDWDEKEGKITTRKLENTLLKPGEYADVTVVLTWINSESNLGLKTNIAEISEDYNEYGTPDRDSVPNNQKPEEDDIDDAPVLLVVKTGEPIMYTAIAVATLAIASVGAVVIKKKVCA